MTADAQLPLGQSRDDPAVASDGRAGSPPLISTDDIPVVAEQPSPRYTQMPTTVHSCNRLGRVGNPPFRAILFGGWWRRRGAPAE